MMKWIAVGLLLVPCIPAMAQQRVVSGQVTYVATGNVYTSLGRQDGIGDSTHIVVLANGDTVARLQVFALSSRSSVCRIEATVREPVVGDQVIARVPVVPPALADIQTSRDSGGSSTSLAERMQADLQRRRTRRIVRPPPVNVDGRISLQYFTSLYEQEAFTIRQPGTVVQLSAGARDVPLTFEMYGTLRQYAYGNASPFGKSAQTRSRIYRLSLSYDDGIRFASVGRIIPSLAPSIGYVDGVMLAHRFGRIRIGALAGFDPSSVEGGLVTTSRKIGVTASYLVEGSSPIAVTAAYARTYSLRTLDREVAGIQANISTTSRMFAFLTGEVDMRRKSGDDFVFHPSLTNVYGNVTFRLTQLLSLGVGASASRPWYSFSRVRTVPDSLLDRKLRGGASVYLNLQLPGGVSLSNNFNPRSSEEGFGKDFTDNVALIFSDPLSSGLFLRSSANLSNNSFTRTLGYGVDIQRNIAGIVDIGLRYQEYMYDVKQIGETHENRTMGADVVIAINRDISIYTSYDRILGYGSNSHSIFTELTIRF